MITVRFPTGFAVTYNNANYLKYHDQAWTLYENEGGRWIASIQQSSGALVEVVRPCSTSNGALDVGTAVDLVIESKGKYQGYSERREIDRLKKFLGEHWHVGRGWKP